MTVLRFTADALSRSRFALSPLAETVAAAAVLHRGEVQPWTRRWAAAAAPAFRAATRAHPLLREVIALTASTRWLPDYITRPPLAGMATRFEDEIAEIASLDDDLVRADLERAGQDTPFRRLPAALTVELDRGDLGPRTAAGLRVMWRSCVEPDWARRRTLLDRDVMARAGLLATDGWAAALEGLHNQVAWVGPDRIRVNHYPGRELSPGPQGLLLVPITFGHGWMGLRNRDQIAVVYPARGTVLHDQPTPDLAALLGPNRAKLLTTLTTPGSPSQLAVQLDLPLGSVGRHLRILLASGLVTRTRVGRRVHYQRSQLGDSLLHHRVLDMTGPCTT